MYRLQERSVRMDPSYYQPDFYSHHSYRHWPLSWLRTSTCRGWTCRGSHRLRVRRDGGKSSSFILHDKIQIALQAYSSLCAVGEMTCFAPVSGTFPHYAARWVDPALGFAIGWVCVQFDLEFYHILNIVYRTTTMLRCNYIICICHASRSHNLIL